MDDTGSHTEWSIGTKNAHFFGDSSYIEELVFPDWCTLKELIEKLRTDLKLYPYGNIKVRLKREGYQDQIIGNVDLVEMKIVEPIEKKWLGYRVYYATVHHLWSRNDITIWVKDEH